MELTKSLRKALEEYQSGDMESGMLHICNAVNAIADIQYDYLIPKEGPDNKSGARFQKFVRDNYWIIEAIAFPLTYLAGCKYYYYPRELGGKPIEVDFATLLYKVHRCTQSHGAETPVGYELIAEEGNKYTIFNVGEHGEVQINARIIPALAMAIVLQDINWKRTYVKELNKYNVFCESIGQMPINDWWGRKREFDRILERSGYYRQDEEPQALLYSLDENNRLKSVCIKLKSEC